MLAAVTISLVNEARGGPFVFWDDWRAACRTAAELGFDGVEIFAPEAVAIDLQAWRQELDALRLNVAAVGTGAGWVKHKLHLCLPDADKRRQAVAFIREIIDLGAEFNAPAIIGSMQGRHGDGVDRATARGWLIDGLRELTDHAASRGVPLLYEQLNRYETNHCNTVESALELMDDVGHEQLKLLCDLFHMNIEEVDIATALKLADDRIGHIHYVDTNRRAAGLGHMNLDPIVAVLKAINYRHYISAEVLPLPDSATAAKRTIESIRHRFGSIAK